MPHRVAEGPPDPLGSLYVVLGALPASAAAATQILYVNGGTVKGYKLVGVLRQDSESIFLEKTKKSVTQAYLLVNQSDTSYAFKAKGDLSSAKASAKLGSLGVLKLKFTATAKKRTQSIPGCFGAPAPARKGTVTGTLKIRFDKGYFKTVTRTKMAAVLTTGYADCSHTGSFGVRSGRVVSASSGALTVQCVSPKHGTLVTEAAVYSPVSGRPKYSIDHVINAHGPLSSVTANGVQSASCPRFSPFSGPLVYAATNGRTQFSSIGTLQSAVSVKFDGVGRKTVPKGAHARFE